MPNVFLNGRPPAMHDLTAFGGWRAYLSSREG
jgi:hypothetical protein